MFTSFWLERPGQQTLCVLCKVSPPSLPLHPVHQLDEQMAAELKITDIPLIHIKAPRIKKNTTSEKVGKGYEQMFKENGSQTCKEMLTLTPNQ